jgi:hypothetical protein
MLPVLLYGCETWSLTLREEPRLRVFENRVLLVLLVSIYDGYSFMGYDVVQSTFRRNSSPPPTFWAER